MANEPTTAKPPFTKVLLKRIMIGISLIAILLVPFVILMGVTKQPAATYSAMGAIIGAVAVMVGGLRIGVLTTVVVALLAPIAIVAGLTPVTGAALMAVLTLVVGRMSRYGLQRAAMLVPIFLAWPILSPIPWIPSALLHKLDHLLSKGISLSELIAHKQHSTSTSTAATSQSMIDMHLNQTYLVWVALFFFIGSIIAVVAVHLALRNSPSRPPITHSRSEAMPYTVTITLLATAATYYFLEHPKQPGGAFMIAAILVLAQVGTEIEWKLTIERVLGTLGGIVLLVAIMAILGGSSYVDLFGIPFPANLYLVGIVFGTAAVIAKFSPRYWIYFVLITPATALLNAYTTSQVAQFGRARLIDNLVGAGLVVLAALITLGASHLTKGSDATPADVAPAAPSPAESPVAGRSLP